MSVKEEYLYSKELLEELKKDPSSSSHAPGLKVDKPGEGLVVRPLSKQDYDRGFLQLLSQLTSVGDISRDAWEARFEEMKAAKDTYLITVIEDTTINKIVGATTLVIEKKFIHSCGSVGRVEDVVVSNEYRGRQLGKLVVGMMQPLARNFGCYKVTLNCTDTMVKYYTGLGYKCEEGNSNFLALRM